jgi:SARP family transcriptional regulator, regulator of embCAB operon
VVWRQVGRSLAGDGVRLYLTGRLTLETPAGTLPAEDLPGRQGLRVLTYLALATGRPVPRDELAAAVWSADPPPARDNALSALLSKIRAKLAALGLPAATLGSAAGCHELRLPAGSWLDVEVAWNRLDRAEGALRRRDPDSAWSDATVACSVLQRPLLPGEEGPWLDRERDRLREGQVRALQVVASAWAERGHGVAAVRAARNAIALAPFRESLHRTLIRAYVVAGDRAEAVRSYERLRVMLREELGIDPAPETERAYLAAMGAG